MGMFDLFRAKSKPASVDSMAPAVDKNISKLARVAGDRHAQNYDRIDAIEALAKLPSPDSAAALLKRFTFHIDPSTTDQEEKEAARAGILAAGDGAIEPIRAFCGKAESLSWPLKILKELVPPERYAQELVILLERFDTEYTRNVDPKSQLLAELEHYRAPEARAAIERFLDDVNESIRFVAVTSLFAQEEPENAGAIAKVMFTEESVRVKIRAAEGLSARGWEIPQELCAELSRALPSGFRLDGCRVQRR